MPDGDGVDWTPAFPGAIADAAVRTRTRRKGFEADVWIKVKSPSLDVKTPHSTSYNFQETTPINQGSLRQRPYASARLAAKAYGLTHVAFRTASAPSLRLVANNYGLTPAAYLQGRRWTKALGGYGLLALPLAGPE